MNEEILGTAAGVLTSVAMVPQVVKVMRSRNAEDLSWGMIAILITGLSLWVWYGIIKNELPIIVSNAFAVLVNITLLICCILYKKKNTG